MLATGRTKVIVLALVLVSVGLLFISAEVYQLLRKPVLAENAPSLVISLDRSTSASKFAALLKQHQLIQSKRLFITLIRAKGLAHKLKAGVYRIEQGDTALDVLDKVVSGDVLTQNFSIIAGTTEQKIAQDLSKAPYLEYHPQDWTFIRGPYANAEGLLLADTYQYRGGSSSKSLLEHAHHNLMTYLDNVWTHREANLPYKTSYELLIAASIIEKETALAQERSLISGVLVNRLNKGMPLQMDPTVIYGLGSQYKGKLSHHDMQKDSPYNTYLYRGLPPTPIAMIGKEAIDAAAHPQQSNYLYYVAKGDGSHQFSATYEQQKKAIHQYQRKDR